MTSPQSPRGRMAALVAATVNGLLILVGAPLLYWGLSSGIPFRSDVTAKVVSIVAPFAALAAWRTWAYATRWIARRDAGWAGVLEAGGTAVLVELALIGAVPFERGPGAIPLVAVYAVVAAMLGVIVGMLLRAAALIVLTILRPPHSTASRSPAG